MSEQDQVMGQQVAVRTGPPPPTMQAGGAVQALIPQSLEEAYRLAGYMALSGLTPKDIKSKEAVLMAIMAGAELGLPPFQAVQSFAIINGRPALWGDAIPALLWSRGFKIKEWYENEDPAYPDNMKARCEVTRPDGEVIPGDFSVADAKEGQLWGKDGPWTKSKKRMLKMRARAFAARDGASDVLRGFQIREEVEDFTPIRNGSDAPTSGLKERLIGSANGEGFAGAIDVEVEEKDLADGADEAPAVIDGIEAEAKRRDEAAAKADEEAAAKAKAEKAAAAAKAKAEKAAAKAQEKAAAEAAKEDATPCEVCGAPIGEQCDPSCTTWENIDPGSWPPDIAEARREFAEGQEADLAAGPQDTATDGARDAASEPASSGSATDASGPSAEATSSPTPPDEPSSDGGDDADFGGSAPAGATDQVDIVDWALALMRTAQGDSATVTEMVEAWNRRKDELFAKSSDMYSQVNRELKRFAERKTRVAEKAKGA